MIKKLLFSALSVAALTAGAQLNSSGTGYTLDNTNAASQCNIDGEGGRVILEAKCGLVSASEDYISFSKSIIDFLKLEVDEKELMGKNARLYFEKEFDREKQTNSIINIFNGIKNN